MIRVITTFLLIAFWASFGCSRSESRSIVDVTRAETMMFKAPRSGAHAIVITASGSLEGSAEVQLILNGAIYQRKNVTGKFTVKLSGDWYSQEAEVRYVPQSVMRGEVVIKARFRTT